MAAQPIVPGNYVTEEAVRLLRDYGITTGITFDPQFRLDRIASKSATEQVRTTLIDPDHLASMVVSMTADKQRGNLGQWPAILVWKTSGTKYDVLNGLHRTTAARKVGLTTFPAVIVDLSNEADPALKAQALKVAANLTNGLPMSREDKITNAVHLYHSGIGGEQAAKIAGISKSTLHNYINYEGVVQRMGINGLGAHVKAFKQGALVAAGKIANDGPFREAITLARSADLSGTEQQELFEKVAAVGDQNRQMAVIKAETQRLENRTKAVASGMNVRPVLSRAVKFRKDLRKVVARFDPDEVLGIFTTPAARTEAIDDLREQRRMLDRSIRVLQKADQPAKTTAKKTAKAGSR